MNGVTPMAAPWVIEVNHIELGLDLIAFGMMEQMIVGNGGKVGVLIIIAVE